MPLSRRKFLSNTLQLAAFAALPITPFSIRWKEENLSYVIKNGSVFLNGAWQQVDIGITAQGTLKISKTPLQAAQIIDATDKIVSAGFIDILADNSYQPENTFDIFEEYKLTDGVTTALQMHGGHHDAAYYYNHFGKKQHWINYGVSVKVMNVRNLFGDLATRLKKVELSLEAGALGVSHSIEYQPTPYEEVLQYAQLAKKYKRTFFLHLRYSSEKQELEGVKEAIKIAQDAQVPVHIDHLHSTGGTFNMPKALELIKNGIKSGLQITTCVYPYSYWATYIPSKRFDDGWQQRYGITYHDLQVVGTGERLTKESFDKYRQGFWRLVAVPENTMDMKKTVDLALQEDFCMIGSDGGIEFSKEANNHPRGAGCFATAIRHGLNIGIPLEKMLDKMTTLPRSIVLPALEKRGKLQDDYMADVVIFDKNKIEGKATVANPNQYSEGIEAVFVNGKLAYHKKQMQTKNGMAIQY